jgi:hypothetical protein
VLTASASARQLRSAHWSRFLEAGFLVVWLLFWIVGEVAGIGLIGAMLASSVAAALGQPPILASLVPPTDGSVTVFLLFALFWVLLWTFGGYAASRHLLRHLAGQDIVDASADGVHHTWRAGPFRRVTTLPRASIHRVRTRLGTHAVVVDTDTGTHELTDLGTVADRQALRTWIAERLALPHTGNREIAPLHHDVERRGLQTVVTHPAARDRRAHQWIMWSLVAVMSLGWINVITGDDLGSASPGQLLGAGATLLAVVLALWLHLAKREWILSPQRLEVRWSWGPWTIRERVFQSGARLELEHTVDSDGDDRFGLAVREGDRRYVLDTALYDQFELLGLGEWISARCGLPFKRPGI